MLSNTERVVSFIANCIAIVGFTAALLGWLEFFELPDYTPPSDRAAKAILIVYALVAAYGVSSFLRIQLDNGRSRVGVTFLSIILSVPYCFAAANLTDWISANMPPETRTSLADITFFWTWLALFAANLLLVGFKMQFPNGFDLWHWLTGMFRGAYWLSLVMMLYHLAAIPLLMREFGLESSVFTAAPAG